MIYSKTSLDLAIKHILPGIVIDPLAYDNPIQLFDVFAAISAIYFIMTDEELDEINTSIKSAFRVIRTAAREYDESESGIIKYGSEELEFLGDSLKLG